MRNKQIYRATNQFRSKQLGAVLSKQLRQKYNRRSARIVIGDTVKIIRGEYKSIDGKVTKVSLEKNSIAIEGIQKEKLKGGKFDIYIHSSNAIITSLNTDDKWRVNVLEHKPNTKSKAEPETKSKAEPETKSNAEPETKSKAKNKIKKNNKSVVKK